MAEPPLDQLLDIAKGFEPWATWLAPGGCLESAHLELAELMRAGIAADRANRGGVALQAFVELQRPLDPEAAAALTPEALWDMYEESPDSAACSGNAITATAMATAERITAQREEILTAFVAKHGFDPDNAVQVTQTHADGRTTWHLERRPQPTAEAK